MCKTLKEWAQADIENNTIPIWHDESLLNRYVVDNKELFHILPRKTLTVDRMSGNPIQRLLDNKILIKEKKKYGIIKPPTK